MHQRDFCRACILCGFERDVSATVVVFLRPGGIDAADNQTQPAALGDTSREKSEILEYVFFHFARGHRLGLALRIAVARTHDRRGQLHRSAVRQNLVKVGIQVGVRYVHRQPQRKLRESADFGGLFERRAVIHSAFAK